MTLLHQADELKKTPLYDRHVSLGGKIVDFGGWALPVQYRSILEEHRWVRSSCGVFDVSHLGEILVKGPGAFQFLQYRLTNDLRKLSDGRILYSLLCDERGFTLDDILIYRESENEYYLIVNAGSIERDLEALRRYAPDGLALENRSDSTACVAVQGPKAEAAMKQLFGFRLEDLRYYHFRALEWQGRPVWVSRSGYTGEDGFEIFCPNETAGPVWDRLVVDGREQGILPAGLGARNTLRLEAGNVLYGNDLDTETTPIEAGLQWAVSFEKGGFVGRDGMMRQKEEGPRRRLVGFRVLDRAPARERYPAFWRGHRAGIVTSGSFGPTVGENIGLAYLERGAEAPGTRFEIEIHGRRVPAEVVKRPFVAPKHKKFLTEESR